MHTKHKKSCRNPILDFSLSPPAPLSLYLLVHFIHMAFDIVWSLQHDTTNLALLSNWRTICVLGPFYMMPPDMPLYLLSVLCAVITVWLGAS